jgi:hypothetical protein
LYTPVAKKEADLIEATLMSSYTLDQKNGREIICRSQIDASFETVSVAGCFHASRIEDDATLRFHGGWNWIRSSESNTHLRVLQPIFNYLER